MKNNMIRKLRKSIVVILLFTIIAPSLTAEAKQSVKNDNASKVIVIDPCGQETKNNKKEPVGPGAFKSTPEISDEFDCETNLQIAKKLGVILAEQGYTVILTRDTNDVDISNSGRAMIANTSNADILVAISGKEKAGLNIVCQTSDNPYNYGNYENSRLLSDAILGSVNQNTKIEKSKVVESDEESIINWCAVPTAKVQIGSDNGNADTNQDLVKGIANGIDSYFSQK